MNKTCNLAKDVQTFAYDFILWPNAQFISLLYPVNHWSVSDYRTPAVLFGWWFIFSSDTDVAACVVLV